MARGDIPFDPHPLFPVEDGDDCPDVSFIQVTRLDPRKGRYLHATELYQADALDSLTKLQERYGGGNYELWARGRSIKADGRPGNITKKARYELDGAPKPLGAIDDSDNNQTVAPIAAPPVPGGAMNDNVIIAMMQMHSQQAALQAQQTQQQSQQFMQLMTAIMQAGKTDSQNMMQMMIQSQAQQSQSMAQMMTALMANRSGGPDEFAKMLDVFSKFKSPGGEPPVTKDDKDLDLGQIMGDIADTVQGVHSIMSMKGGGPQTVETTVVPPNLPPNGT